ncbi:hypothetical protein ACLMJK_006853 [Lecanora helva]
MDDSPFYQQIAPTALPRAHTPMRKTTGYAQVADFISTDTELAVYRRFDKIAARILLGLQSKILLKQERLRVLDGEDALESSDKKPLSSVTIYEEVPEPSPKDKERKHLHDDLKNDLKEYCKQSSN